MNSASSSDRGPAWYQRFAFHLGLAAFLAAAPVLGSPDGALTAGTASGTFSIDGKSVTLKHAYAMGQPNTFDEKKTDTVILLTEKPLAEGALAEIESLQDAARGMENYLVYKLNEKGESISEIVHHRALGERSLQMSGMTNADFRSEAFTPQRVAGTFATKGAEDFMGHPYEIRVRFDAPVKAAKAKEPLPDAKTGKKLPADGGEPGKAYMAFDKAIRTKDAAAIRKMNPSETKDVSDKDMSDMLELMAAMSPANVKIVEGYQSGDTAVLYLTGVEGGQKRYGTVTMKKSGGAWLPGGQKWSDKPAK
jgi:hypothetical protein